MDDALRRLRPDPENWPAWLRAELGTLGERHAHLPPEDRLRVARAQLSPRARGYIAEQARRADVAYRALREAHRIR